MAGDTNQQVNLGGCTRKRGTESLTEGPLNKGELGRSHFNTKRSVRYLSVAL